MESPATMRGLLYRGKAAVQAPAGCLYSSPRMVAGDSIKGDVFKCALKSVDTALADGTFPATVVFTPVQQDWFKLIFPTGVCDYSKAGAGRPAVH
jgi:hypothetical protein